MGPHPASMHYIFHQMVETTNQLLSYHVLPTLIGIMGWSIRGNPTLIGSSWTFGYGSIPMKIPFLGGYSHPFTSYFDVNIRGTRFWHTAIYLSIYLRLSVRLWLRLSPAPSQRCIPHPPRRGAPLPLATRRGHLSVLPGSTEVPI